MDEGGQLRTCTRFNEWVECGGNNEIGSVGRTLQPPPMEEHRLVEMPLGWVLIILTIIINNKIIQT